MKKTILLLIPIFLAACTTQTENHAIGPEDLDKIRTSNSPESVFRIAESMKNSGNYDTAAKMYDQAITMDPTMHIARIGFSECMRKTGRNDAAMQTLSSTPPDAQNVTWHKELGSVYTASLKPRECVSAYKKAHEMDPNDIEILNGLAVCNDLIGQHAQAQELYQKALTISPSHSQLRSNYGLSLSLSGKSKEGIEQLKCVVNSPDARPRDRQNLATAYGINGQMDKAAEFFAIDLDKTDVRTNLAFVHKLAGTQHLATAQTSSSQKHSFETKLADEQVKKEEPKTIEDKIEISEKSLESEPTENLNGDDPLATQEDNEEQMDATANKATTPEARTIVSSRTDPHKKSGGNMHKKTAARKKPPVPGKSAAHKKPAKHK